MKQRPADLIKKSETDNENKKGKVTREDVKRRREERKNKAATVNKDTDSKVGNFKKNTRMELRKKVKAVDEKNTENSSRMELRKKVKAVDEKNTENSSRPDFELPTSKKGSVCINVVDYDNSGNKLDIRYFYYDENGSIQPTKKGINIDIALALPLYKGLRALLKKHNILE
jgi:5'-3' exonuclease